MKEYGSRAGLTIFAFIFLMTYAAGCQPTTPKHGGLELKSFQIPKDAKIIGFEFHLAGAFESVSNLPVGWSISVDNDLAWEAILEAHAKLGSPAVTEHALRNLGMQVAATGFEDLRPKAWGWITVRSEDNKEKRLPLSLYSFEFIEQYHRHRLSTDAKRPY